MTSVHDFSAAPWPNLTAKRCLVLAGDGFDLSFEATGRGASDVVVADADPEVCATLGRFDVVVAVAALSGSEHPDRVCAGIRCLTDGLFLSVEPVDLTHTIIGRRRGWMSRTGPGGGWSFNGARHRQLLVQAGFRVERVCRPFTVQDQNAPARLVERAAVRLATGRSGIAFRGILARPTRP